jgi:hypothetical protein
MKAKYKTNPSSPLRVKHLQAELGFELVIKAGIF